MFCLLPTHRNLTSTTNLPTSVKTRPFAVCQTSGDYPQKAFRVSPSLRSQTSPFCPCAAGPLEVTPTPHRRAGTDTRPQRLFLMGNPHFPPDNTEGQRAREHLDAFGVLFVKGADVKGVGRVHFSPRRDQGRRVLEGPEEGGSRTRRLDNPAHLTPPTTIPERGLSVQLTQISFCLERPQRRISGLRPI